MKFPVSVSLDEGTIAKIRGKLRSSSYYRNKSHLIETAIERLLENEQDS
mgnify:CR=1 FL=1